MKKSECWECDNERPDPGPSHIIVKPLLLMTEEERATFESHDEEATLCPEVGSRAMQRMFVSDGNLFNEGCVIVQEGNYRFQINQSNGLSVKIVLREYLGCEIVWG
jgi:hypothetical protein